MSPGVTADLAATPTLPPTLEVCIRVRDGVPCVSPIFRPGGGATWCYRCGAVAGPIALYQRQDEATR